MIARILRIGTPMLLTVLVAAQAHGQITKQGKGYLFRMKLTKGQTMNYSVESVVSAAALPGGKMTVHSPMTMHVVSVIGGIAEVKATVGPMDMNGQKGPVQNLTMKMNTQGKVVGSKQPGLQGMSTSLPDKPIPIGGTWTAKVPMNMAMGASQETTAVYKFTGVKNVGGRQCAVIAVSLKGNGTGTGTTMLSMADGSLVKTNMKMNLTTPGPNGQPMAMSVLANVNRK